jgi:hypothetical protein
MVAISDPMLPCRAIPDSWFAVAVAFGMLLFSDGADRIFFRPDFHRDFVAQKTAGKGFDEAIKEQGATSDAAPEKIGKQQLAQPETDFQLDTRRIPPPVANILGVQAA